MFSQFSLKRKDIFYSLPFLLIAPSLISGPFFADLFCIIIAIIGIFFLKNNNNIFFKFNYFFFYFFSFYIWILISSLISDNIFLSLESSLFYFRYFFYAFGIYAILSNNENISLNYFLIISFLSIIIVAVTIFYEFYHSYFFNNLIQSQYTGIFSSDKLSGSFTLRLYPLILGIILYFKYNKYLILLLIFMATFNIFMSGERTAILLFILQNILFFLCVKELRLIFIKIFLISLIPLFLIIFFSTNQLIKRITIDSYQDMFTNDKFTFFSNIHESHYITALKIYKDHKIIGSGPKSFRVKCNDSKYKLILKWWIDHSTSRYKEQTSCSTHPHNSYIQLLTETGIVGFSFLLILEIFILLKLLTTVQKEKHKKKKYNIIFISSLICIYINFFPFSPNGNFFNNWINVLYYLPIGFLIFYHVKLKLNDNYNF